ncbi:hypothetical protein GA0115254_128715 [Streptomyces sp. Ncost-T10-10d]|nr:hypothetical protein GA0115254_128715 [Streptomyces sp. Ncost-T10-10d]
MKNEEGLHEVGDPVRAAAELPWQSPALRSGHGLFVEAANLVPPLPSRCDADYAAGGHAKRIAALEPGSGKSRRLEIAETLTSRASVPSRHPRTPCTGWSTPLTGGPPSCSTRLTRSSDPRPGTTRPSADSSTPATGPSAVLSAASVTARTRLPPHSPATAPSQWPDSARCRHDPDAFRHRPDAQAPPTRAWSPTVSTNEKQGDALRDHLGTAFSRAPTAYPPP